MPNGVSRLEQAFIERALMKASCAAGSAAALAACTALGTGPGKTLTEDAPLGGVALVVDGVTLGTVGQRVLIKDQVAQDDNGVYVVATVGAAGVAWVLERAQDFDDDIDLVSGAIVTVLAGTVNAGRQFSQVTATPAVDTDNLVFSETTVTPRIDTGTGTIANGANSVAIAGLDCAATTHMAWGVIESDDTGGTLGGIESCIISGAGTVTLTTNNNGTNADAAVRVFTTRRPV